MTTPGPDTDLRRRLDLADGVALFVGVIVGSGIFVAPSAVAAAAAHPVACALAWIAGAVVAGCGALCYAECGARLPRAGGFFEFYRVAHGRPLADVAGWVAVLVTYPASIAAIAHVGAQYLGRLVPVPAGGVSVIAALAIAAATALNVAGVRAGATTQRVLTGAKVLALAALCAAAALAPAAAPSASAAAAPPVAPADFAAILLAAMVVLWTYDGWSDVTLIAGELRDPARSLGRTVLLGMAVVAALYVGVQLAVMSVLGPAAASSEGVVAQAVSASLGPHAGALVAGLVVLATFGSVNGVVLAAGRIPFAMARAGSLPAGLGIVHARLATPARSIALLGLVAVAYALVASFRGLVELFTAAVWVFYAITAIALVRLRRRRVGEPLAWRAPGGWLVPAVVIAMAALMTGALVAQSPWRAVGGMALLAAAIAARAIVRRR